MFGQKLLLSGLSFYGLKAIYGPLNEPKIVQFFKKIGLINIENDETPWCSVFIMALTQDLGLFTKANPSARSWLNCGVIVEKPEIGDVCIFWRESKESWKGHVGLYVSENSHSIYILGGNQGGGVNIAPFPKSQLLGIRRLSA